MQSVTDDSAKLRRQLDAQIERWTAEAKKLVESGKEVAGLELYQRAADELPGAPWLQHRTAELARRLKKNDIAVTYFRRAATAFQIADFPKRGVAPLRTAWSLAVEGLPATSKLLVELALELMQLHRRLGFAADATVTFERTNAALRARGFSEIPLHTFEAQRETPSTRSFAPPARTPSSGPPRSKPGGSRSNDGPRSDVAPRALDATEAVPQPRNRAQTLGRIFGRG
jgi:hypothetical protein